MRDDAVLLNLIASSRSDKGYKDMMKKLVEQSK